MDIKGTTRVCGLIGNPVGHSVSPAIHNNLAQLTGKDMVYTTFKVEKGDVKTAVKGAYSLNILGLNVTVPHKSEVIDTLVDIDPLARAIGAVNTLVRVEGGFKGYNTDILGLARELEDEGIELENSKVIILGAGGAARAITFLCSSKNAQCVYLLNRTVDKAEAIAQAVNAHFNNDKVIPMNIADYADIPGEDYVVIQTTSVGLHPNDEAVVIDDEAFYKKAAVGVDIIYNPANTKFMKLIKAQGKNAYNGLKMLLYQGVSASSSGMTVRLLRKRLMRCINVFRRSLELMNNGHNNIILIGFMGSGKTTFGKWITRNHNMEFLDTDEYIENKYNKLIKDIFRDSGEETFRDMETQAIKELAQVCDNCVISVGGGLPVRAVNRSLLKELGIVVYLEASVDELVKRLSKDTSRPLLAGGNLREKIESLMAAREALYKEAADIIVKTDDRRFEDMYTDVVTAINMGIMED